MQVTDANDNCPVMNSTGLVLPLVAPPLSADDPLVALNVTDKDSYPNAQVLFALSDVQSR